MPSFAELVELIRLRSSATSHLAVGISGYGGSGKSTLARALVRSVSGSIRVRGDDFLDPARSHHRSQDWDGMDRVRLRQEVLEPFRLGRTVRLRRFNWSTRALGPSEQLPDARVLIVDAVGLFHPELNGMLDVKIWIDLDLRTATERGKARDRALGRSHDRLWDDVWVPNDREFAVRFHPAQGADVLHIDDADESWRSVCSQ
ncbi:MAG TPA: phosphoglycerate transporter [Humibacter sp.]|nr:phosphoglycerate transporter [Humibacter sp.]